jgi:hypothetical protein
MLTLIGFNILNLVKNKNMKKIKLLIMFLIVAGIFFTCNDHKDKTQTQTDTIRAKFEPEDGKCILFIGQDLGAIGGLEDYNDGYADHFDLPGGFTMYTTFMPGVESFGFTYKGLDGVTTTDNWGSGDCNMQMQIDDPNFKDMALAIGLQFVDHDSLTAVGAHDDLIIKLGEWIKTLDNRPVFLRIGYEFDAPDWNHYDSVYFKQVFRRVRSMFDSLEVKNVAYVWQSKGWGTTEDEFNAWYPGDDYVDWCGYTHFVWGVEGGKPMIDFARKHNKPVFIAEATPMIFQGDTLPQECFLTDTAQANHAWESWFIPFFNTIHENQDVVKAISYINVNWPSQAMWENSIPFKYIDSRLQVNPEIKQRWIEEVSKDLYLKASPTLFNYLWGEEKP